MTHRALGMAVLLARGIPTGQSPKNVYGHGRIDALAAVTAGRDRNGTCGR
jgi:hypothetical protein